MENNGTVKKIGFVAFSNIIKLISSILIAFVVPKILGVTNYGYYKVFILYLTYIGLFHFGFIDGIYLKYGGNDYEELNKKSFRTYLKFLLYLELLIAILGILFTLLFIDGEKKIIFLFLFFNLIAINLTTFYQFVSQITSRFKEYSIRIVLLSIANIIIVGVLYFLKIDNHRIYIALTIIANYILLFWYLHTYRDITFGKGNKIKDSKIEIIFFFKTGIPLLLANLATTLVLTVDKQIVEIFFSVEEFGVYSFAYSMLAIITVVVTAIGVVLYPTLKKTNIKNIAENYSNLNTIVILVVLIGLLSYYPLVWLIPKFLPDYTNSLNVFRIALPGIVLTSSISAIKHNFYKITDKNFHFFLISIIAILTNLALNLGAYFVFKTTIAIAISSVIGLGIWYITTEVYMIKKFKVKWKINALLAIVGMVLFYLSTFINNFIIAGTVYLVFLIIIIAFNYKNILKTIKK